MSDVSLPFPLGHGSVTATTRHGRSVRIRNIVPADDVLLLDLYHNLSPETRRLRFMAPRPDLPAEVLWPEMIRFSHINVLVEAALVALIDEPEAASGLSARAVGVARLIRDDDNLEMAEVAIVLRDDVQREGLGTLLFDLLIQVAMVRGLKRLRAVTLAENDGMRQLVRKSGLAFRSSTSYGETTITIDLTAD